MTIPQIDSGKSASEPLHVGLMMCHGLTMLPTDTPYGNMCLKYMKIILRMDHLNRLIQSVFSQNIDVNTGPMAFTELRSRQEMNGEEIVYWIRKTVDELLALYYFIRSSSEDGHWPKKLAVDCIHDVLREKDKGCPAPIAPHLPFLEMLNNISNALKHSFINSDQSHVGLNEPIVFALALKNNDLARHPPVFYGIALREVIETFSLFFVAMKQNLCK